MKLKDEDVFISNFKRRSSPVPSNIDYNQKNKNELKNWFRDKHKVKFGYQKDKRLPIELPKVCKIIEHRTCCTNVGYVLIEVTITTE